MKRVNRCGGIKAVTRWSGRLRDRTASVALIFALSVFPIAGVIGLAIDLGFVSQSKAQLNSAADVAALAAAKATADAFTAGLKNYIAAGQTAGAQWFSSQGTAIPSTTVPSTTVVVAQNGAVFVSTVTYQAAVSTYFSRLFGIATIPVSGLASATISANAYISVTFLLDNSSSMLVAATPAGVAAMGTLTPVNAATPGRPAALTAGSVPNGLGSKQCAFACHWDAAGNDYYGLARANNIQLRFDVVQSAVQLAIGEMINEEVIPNQFSTGIYTFGTCVSGPTCWSSVLAQIYPVGVGQSAGTDLVSAKAAALAMRTPVVVDQANTNFPAVMVALTQQSKAAGDGSSPASPKKALIIVTDGLADYGSRQIPTTEGPIDPQNCLAMKNLGYNVYVLYTTYITAPLDFVLLNNHALLNYINGTATPAMTTSLQSCASSPTNFFQASDPAAITAAMTQMLKAALGNGGRFTN